MSEKMTPIPFDKLITWMLEEYRSKCSVFWIDKSKFYSSNEPKLSMFGDSLGTPLGPAAGPNTQLAQNLVTAYVSGFRFMELKTVQTLDGEELAKLIPRPCINAQDEGYNCEWSTELTVQQAYEEYVKGWFAVHVVAKELGLSDCADVIFNMSVGYDYEGITSPKIDSFIEGLKDGSESEIWKSCKKWLLDNISMFSNVAAKDIEDISPNISSSITLSTLHGCPPQEIERIADYFLTRKNMHTYVKLNPTLLGYEFVRNTLDNMGYDYVNFDTTHFDQDLKMPDALALIERLKKTAKGKGLSFGVKVSNTFPVQIKQDELPGEYMYMSGRALFPLSINVAARLSEHFDGELPISYSGGADYFNIDELLKAGIKPVTVATTILKPGGYARAKQMCEKTDDINIPEKIDVDTLSQLAADSIEDKHLVKDARDVESRKTSSKLRMFNCFKSPCQDGGCPINQQIPAYLSLVEQGKYVEALRVITIDNPLPNILGQICTHVCQSKCTRIDYDESLRIRQAKGIAASNASKQLIDSIKPVALATDKKVAIIGAGPAGVSAGVFLRRNGVNVTVFEKLDRPMGVVSHIIPKFRISQDKIDADVAIAEKTGVGFVFGADEKFDLAELKNEYDFVIIATGAWKKGFNPVKSGGEHLIDALEFLEESRLADCDLVLGKNVAVIGGGDVAMDCARAAKRSPGTKNVHIVYRRTRQFMPAEREELELALADGVEFKELYSPVSYDGKDLKVCRMELGEVDTDGRRKTIATDETQVLQYDTVISAIGARVDSAPFEKNNIARKETNANNETNIDGVYLAGDCKSGASTIVKAVADSKKIASDILSKCGLKNDFTIAKVDISEQQIRKRKAVLADAMEGKQDCERCLACGEICEICCEVCPNRANISIMVDGAPQIVHIDRMCNECGNCKIFCPHDGDPAKVKATLFHSEEAFNDSENKGWAFIDEYTVLVRDINGKVFECSVDSKDISPLMHSVIKTMRNDYRYII